jgi:RNA polymerase sigma factor (sigma-70 family)
MIDDESRTEELAVRAAGGDPVAWSELIRRLAPGLTRTAAVLMQRSLVSHLDPADAVRDALRDAHQRLGEYLEQRPLPLAAWLRQRVRDRLGREGRHADEAARRRRGIAASPLENTVAWGGSPGSRLFGSASTSSDRASRREASDRLVRSLARLKPADREVIQLTILEGYDLSEAALILDSTPDAVRVRRVRALRRLAAWLPSGSSLDSR